MQLLETIRRYEADAVALRRELHRHPELSTQETETTACIRRELERCGIEIVDSGLDTGVIALLHGTKAGGGKVLALRADIDALPVREATGEPFASERDGVSHACGHDLHTSALLLCARALKDHADEFSGTVKFLFQPAEENGAGSKTMIAHGAMENPKPDMIVAEHTWPDTPAGKIGWYKGGAMASSDTVVITIRGKGGHGAHPYRSIDPVTVAAYLITQLQTVISREVPALEAGVLSFGVVEAGTAPNVIPDQVVLKGTMRALSAEWRTKMADAIRRISEQCCAAMRATAQVEIVEGMPVLENESAVIDRIVAAAEASIGAACIEPLKSASMGSEDFSRYLAYAPGALFRMGTGNADDATHCGLHNAGNRFDEQGIAVGAAVMAQLALDFCR